MSRRRRRARRDVGAFNLSFLDAISCGFGAIVILLVLTKMGEPQALVEARGDLAGRIVELERELAEIRAVTREIEPRLTAKRRTAENEEARIERLRGDLERIQGRYAATLELSEVREDEAGRLVAARQKLSEEMRRLLARDFEPPPDAPVGGIPVDSEYIVFIVDTSGSMQQGAWTSVQEKMREVLDLYPEVKGMQVMNDMGQYLFGSYAGNWIPDTPGRRRLILSALRDWNAFSNSSPVEGIQRAITAFARQDKKISIYVFGDEFSGDSIEEVLKVVDRINSRDAAGNPRVRIHAVGFPTMFSQIAMSESTGVRFATLMRELARRNGGAFVGLNRTR